MALAHVTLPEKLFTDCDSVRLGTRQSKSWAGSAKRRLARIWCVISSQLDDSAEIVHWMPAHTTEASIGSVKCSNGQILDEELWHANQLVDFLAKEGAELVRLSPSVRRNLLFREQQILELVIFLGKLTHAANSFVRADGVICRDSEGVQRKHKRRKRVVKPTRSACVGKPVRKKVPKESVPFEWLEAWSKACNRAHGSVTHAPTKATSIKRAKANITVRQDAAFCEWWREGRSHYMQSQFSPRPCLESLPDIGAKPPVAQQSGRISRSRSESSVQFVRTHIVSQYDRPQSSLASISVSPRVGAESRSVQPFSAGCCGNCGDSLSTQLHIDARGPCGTPSRGGVCLPHVSESMPSASTTVRSATTVCDRDFKGYHIVRKRQGVSNDGFCLVCGDAMSTSMHLSQGGPCLE